MYNSLPPRALANVVPMRTNEELMSETKPFILAVAPSVTGAIIRTNSARILTFLAVQQILELHEQIDKHGIHVCTLLILILSTR